MQTAVNAPVSVLLSYDAVARATVPRRVKWAGRTYEVQEVGLRHPVRRGRAVAHVFTVNVGSLDMRLSCDGGTLQWTLEWVSDGLPD